MVGRECFQSQKLIMFFCLLSGLTELENLKITLKGWNMATSVFQALPFTRDTAQPVGGVVNNDTAAGICDEGHQELFRERGEEDADKEFNFVENDNDFDDLYLI